MSQVLAYRPPRSPRRISHSERMKALSDAAKEVLRKHELGDIDADEAARQLRDLKNKNRTFLDRLIG